MTPDFEERVMQSGPVGRWVVGVGTETALFGETIVFQADGTGSLSTRSLAFGAETIAFAWRMAGRGALEIREADPDDDDSWRPVAMAFQQIETDVGAVTVLTEPGRDGFWLATAPLSWLGPADDEAP